MENKKKNSANAELNPNEIADVTGGKVVVLSETSVMRDAENGFYYTDSFRLVKDIDTGDVWPEYKTDGSAGYKGTWKRNDYRT